MVILIVDSGALVDHVLLLLCGVFCRMEYLLLLSVQPERLMCRAAENNTLHLSDSVTQRHYHLPTVQTQISDLGA